MPREPSRLRRQLGQELKRLRVRAGLPLRFLDTPDATVRVAHARVHRIEQGTATVSLPQVNEWLQRVGADDADRERIEVLAAAAQSEAVRYDDAIDDHGGHLQQVAGDRERDSTRILVFEHAYLPGLLQTPAYARAILESFRLGEKHDDAAAAAARMDRQALLYETGREFRFLFPERLLHWTPGDVPLNAQVARLHDLAQLPAVEIRVLPDGERTPINGFVIHERMVDGSSLVVIELEHTQLPLADIREIETYTEMFWRLWSNAAPIAASQESE